MSQLEQINKNFPLLVDPTDGTLCIVCSELEKRARKVIPNNEKEYEKLAKVKAQDLIAYEKRAADEAEVNKLPKAEQLKR